MINSIKVEYQGLHPDDKGVMYMGGPFSINDLIKQLVINFCHPNSNYNNCEIISCSTNRKNYTYKATKLLKYFRSLGDKEKLNYVRG